MNLKNYLVLTMFSALLFATGCGGGGSSNSFMEEDDEEDVVLDSEEANKTLEELSFAFNGNNGEVVQGSPPPKSNSSGSPLVSSAPDKIETTRNKSERIDIIFDTDDAIKDVFVNIEGATQYVKLANGGNTGVSARTEAISVFVNTPDDIEDKVFCLDISTADVQNLVSDTAKVCFEVSNVVGVQRIIHFADFSANSTLSTLNFDNGEVNNIGGTGFTLTDIAFLDGKLYGVTSSQLIEINVDTGEGTLIGNLGAFGVNALEGKDGVLYAASTIGDFLTINPNTGVATRVSSLGTGVSSSGDLVFNEDKTSLFGTVNSIQSATDDLIKINPSTGSVEFLGETGFDLVYGLVYLRNQLLGLTDAGEFIILNPTTGEGTLVENTDAFSAGGASLQ